MAFACDAAEPSGHSPLKGVHTKRTPDLLLQHAMAAELGHRPVLILVEIGLDKRIPVKSWWS